MKTPLAYSVGGVLLSGQDFSSSRTFEAMRRRLIVLARWQ